MNTTQTAPLTLHPSAMTRRLRAARLGVIRSYALADGALRVFAYGTDEARAIAAHLLQAGYAAAATGDRVTVTLPEPEYDGPADDDECGQCGSPRSSARHTPLGHAFVEAPVIVRAGEAAPLAEQEAPRQDLPAGGELRVDEHGARYWTAEEIVAERAAHPARVCRSQTIGCDDRDCSLVIGHDLDDEEPEVRSGTGPERQRHAELLADLLAGEPGPEVDDPREQPRPVVWSEVATPSLPALDGRPRVLRYRR